VDVSTIHFGWGFSIRLNYNDDLDITVGGTPYAGTVAAGDYGPEGLAAAVQAGLNAIPSTGRTFTVTYSYSTNKFTVAASGGNYDLDGRTGPSALTSAWPSLGFDLDHTGAATYTASWPRYAERFWVNSNDGSEVTFLFATGTSAATCCYGLFGYLPTDSSPSLSERVAPYRRNNREALLSTAETTWGERESLSVAADYIRAETVAVVLRDRLADLLRNPPMRVSFATHRCPDLQRGRVLPFAADVDDLAPYAGYGSDGSWAGKSLRVVEVISHNVTAWHDEVSAVEV
jgi:hypothetical protein